MREERKLNLKISLKATGLPPSGGPWRKLRLSLQIEYSPPTTGSRGEDAK
ncbi:hypothetical protein [Nocardia amikacinitolerans]|nr:hypothetical protein [Nocardia amikacinitolerans]MCP2280177.1 hypothetical protein [Nocardia amikacinitolerans]MCP2299448.1 hypothetical protein [Nocardia amikacinitolerans]